MKQRLDQELVARKLVASRSQAESYIKLGEVMVNGHRALKAGMLVSVSDKIKLTIANQYVSRAALKLQSVAAKLKLEFENKTILDVGSSTGGFTDYALRHGAKKVIAVDVGTNQLHPSLRNDPRIELHEKTDIRDFRLKILDSRIEKKAERFKIQSPNSKIDIVLIDVSFISLREVLPHIAGLMSDQTELVAMAKPQFETDQNNLKHKGVIKNEKVRREVLNSLESWIKNLFVLVDKADSEISGAKGNRERFYLLTLNRNSTTSSGFMM